MRMNVFPGVKAIRLLACGAVVVVALARPAVQVWAQGIPVIDASSLIQNTMTAMQSVMAYAKQLEQYEQEIRSYQAQLQNMANLPQQSMSGLQSLTGFNTLQVANAINSVNSLYGSLQGLQSMWQQRYDAAKQAGTSVGAYMQWEQDAVSRGVQGAQERAQSDRATLESVIQTWGQVQQWQAMIPATKGVNESMNVMNQQMNTVIQQNSKVIEMMARDSLERQEAKTNSAALAQSTREQLERNAEAANAAVDQANAVVNSIKY